MAQSDLRLYFENPVGRILEHPDGYAVIQYREAPRKFHHLQAFLTHIAQLLQRRGWHKLLADQRLMSPFTEQESGWIVDHWLAAENTNPNGIYGAILLPNDVFARLSLSQVMQEAKTAALTYRMFDEEAAAETWLLQLP